MRRWSSNAFQIIGDNPITSVGKVRLKRFFLCYFDAQLQSFDFQGKDRLFRKMEVFDVNLVKMHRLCSFVQTITGKSDIFS